MAQISGHAIGWHLLQSVAHWAPSESGVPPGPTIVSQGVAHPGPPLQKRWVDPPATCNPHAGDPQYVQINPAGIASFGVNTGANGITYGKRGCPTSRSCEF